MLATTKTGPAPVILTIALAVAEAPWSCARFPPPPAWSLLLLGPDLKFSGLQSMKLWFGQMSICSCPRNSMPCLFEALPAFRGSSIFLSDGWPGLADETDQAF